MGTKVGIRSEKERGKKNGETKNVVMGKVQSSYRRKMGGGAKKKVLEATAKKSYQWGWGQGGFKGVGVSGENGVSESSRGEGG